MAIAHPFINAAICQDGPAAGGCPEPPGQILTPERCRW